MQTVCYVSGSRAKTSNVETGFIERDEGGWRVNGGWWMVDGRGGEVICPLSSNSARACRGYVVYFFIFTFFVDRFPRSNPDDWDYWTAAVFSNPFPTWNALSVWGQGAARQARGLGRTSDFPCFHVECDCTSRLPLSCVAAAAAEAVVLVGRGRRSEA